MVVQNKQQFRGVTLDQPTIDALLVAESILGYQLRLPQGSYNAGGVAASAGTHDGGGAMDVSINGGSDPTAVQVAKVRALRQAGFAAWRRTPSEGFAYHIHCEQIGNPWLSPAAASQIVQWNQGRNGLADHAPDDDAVDVAAGRPPAIGSKPLPPVVPPVVTPPVTPATGDRRRLDEDIRPKAPSNAPPPPTVAHVPIPVSAVTYGRYNGGGNVDEWIQAACGYAGVPYNAYWRIGYETICMRESSDDPNAVNNYDSNAVGPVQADGNPAQCSRGDAQCIPTTFAAYHCQGCSDDIYDAIANIASSMVYVMDRYGVSSDGSDLAEKVQQADPGRSPMGY